MKKLFIIAVSILLTACGSTPQGNVSVDSNFFQNKETVIGVYSQINKQTDTYLYGADCLLCYMAAAAANSSLTSHFKSLEAQELSIIGDELAQRLKAQGLNVKNIETEINIGNLKKFSTKEINYHKNDFRSLKELLGVDKLIVVNFPFHGAARYYSGYIPNGPPTSYVNGSVFMVDLETNKLDQFKSIELKLAVQGEWDEPPAFPGLTNAFYEALELAKDQVREEFKYTAIENTNKSGLGSK